ncbi:MAG: 6,7-dimethyl-8-ribityllumazine synthase [Salinivirgaceae bacterium]|nr:6,7-dimethyl-8-ribityllumazine synthase [Salinivirgaceae bacterium]MDD4747877.1 6,7-dimethyl-8-ribityllumazine synthase [Salinivirgaceae bacterium]
MATLLKNLSDYDFSKIPNAKKMRFGIVVSEWNDQITMALCKGAVETLMAHGANEGNIEIIYVPGSFELSYGSQILAQRADIDAVIALGCVIQGETRHFDFICQGVAQGITSVSLKYNKPVIFGVLTTNTQQQALDRAGGKHGNKGIEAAVTAIKMVALTQ